MKKTILALVMLGLSTGVLAQSLTAAEQQQVDAQMQQMERGQEEVAVIMIDENSSYATVEFVGKWVASEQYVSHKEAKKMQLQQVNKHFVYAKTGESLESLEQTMMARIAEDSPRYFSVDVYRDYHGDSGDFNYLARIVEYK
ncbi:hypothetical protein [uncultured Vibrio sp.]|uniref:hypothetical protein n=1 Tax=uncultured Vibrio sp. TaxID=114054 RepID=UPI00263851B8|nr:hypothetical protein [uncultured Vibrio sp.]